MMFRKLSLALLVALVATSASAVEPGGLSVEGFAGQVLDTMGGTTKNGFTGGLLVDYGVTKEVDFFVETFHSKRRAEEQLSEIIFDADSFEWRAGIRYTLKALNQGQTKLQLVGEGGFIQLVDTPGDVVDDHFLGFGLEHSGGDFAGSRLLVGYGKSDTFAAHENSRFKVMSYLTYKGVNLPLDAGIMLNASLDSDLRSGTDGTRVVLATLIPFDSLFQ